MKKYVQPQMVLVGVSLQQMIAESVELPSTPDMPGFTRHSNKLWDDDDDDWLDN